MVLCQGIRLESCEELFFHCPLVPEYVAYVVARLQLLLETETFWNPLFLEEDLLFRHVCPNIVCSVC